MGEFDWKRFYYLSQEILQLLAEQNFLPPLSALQVDVRRIIAADLEWHGIEVMPPPENIVGPAGPGPLQLDLLSLDCAKIYAKHGIKGAYYNEALNGIRLTIRQLLKHFGCMFLWDFGGNTLWDCYTEWPELARECGLSAERIKAACQDHREGLLAGRGCYFTATDTEEDLAKMGVVWKKS